MKIDPLVDKINKRIEDVLDRGPVSLSGIYARSGLKEGKKLRAKLLLAFSGEESGRAIDTACSIELLHAATLIHDDVLDNSSSRRGKAALYLERGVPESILYGDYLFTEAFKLISALKDPLITHETISALSLVLKGEIIEQSKRGEISLGRKEYFSVIEMKSGVLFGISAKLGALIRAAKGFDADSAYGFGLNAGIAYQMVDDYMDYFGADDGKEGFNDIKEGIVTLPLIILLERCSPDEKKYIGSVLLRKAPPGRATRKISELMDIYAVAQDVLAEAGKFTQRAGSWFEEGIYGGIRSRFDIVSLINDRIMHAQKEYRSSRRRVRGSQRAKAAQKA